MDTNPLNSRQVNLKTRRKTLSIAIVTLLYTNVSQGAAVNWVPNSDGFWDVVTNWSSDPNLPGISDDVLIDVGGATIRTITHRSGTDTIKSLSSQEAFVKSFGTLNINETSSFANTYTQTNGTLGGTGNVSIAGATTLTGGTMTGVATTSANGNTLINGGFSLSNGRTLVLNGDTVWSGGSPSINSTATLINSAGSTFTTGINGTIFGNGNFQNNGTFVKNASTGTSQINPVFNNASQVNVDSGTLALNGGGTQTGDFSIAQNATLSLSGNHQLTNVDFGASTGRLVAAGGSINTTGAIDFGGELAIQFATLTANDSIDTASYTQTNGTLGGTGNVSIAGATTLTGGTMTGVATTSANGNTLINGGFSLSNGRTLALNGDTVWSGGSPSINSASTLINSAGSTFTTGINGTIFGNGNFQNNGTFVKNASTGTSQINPVFNNAGQVNVDSGTLALNGGGTQTGDFSIAQNATLSLSGNHQLTNVDFGASTGRLVAAGSSINTTGAIDFGGELAIQFATLTANDSIDTASYTQTNGTLGGTGDVSIAGATTLTGGTMTGVATTSANGNTLINGGFSLSNGRTLVLNGDTVWSGGSPSINSASTLINSAGSTFTTGINGTIFGNGNFQNNGTFVKNASTGTTTINPELQNNGLLDVQSGTVNLAKDFTNQGVVNVEQGGTLTVSAASFVNGVDGVLQGEGILDPVFSNDLINSGTIYPGSDGIGSLTVAGDFMQTASGLLSMEIGGTDTLLDILNITGDATFGGTLKVESFGSFVPEVGDIFTLITFDGLGSGAFASLDASAFTGLGFETVYNADNVQLKVVSAAPVPVPAAMWLFMSGIFGVFFVGKRR